MILHVFKKDLRRLRWLLAPWFFLVAIQGALAFAGSPFVDARPILQAAFSTASNLAPSLQALLLLLIVPLLVQDDPLADSRAFWLTRPIHARTLLGAKLLFVLLLLVLPPLAVELVGLAFSGVTPKEWLLSVPVACADHLDTLVVAGVLAALTPGFASYVVVGVVGLIALSLGSVLYNYLWFALASEARLMREIAASLTASRGLIGQAATVALGAGLLAHQYLTRNTRRSVVAAAAALLAIGTCQMFWPWDFLKWSKPLPREPWPLEKLALTPAGAFSRAVEAPSIRPRPGKPPRRQFLGKLNLSRPEGPWVVLITRARSTIEYPDGAVLRSDIPQRQSQALVYHDWDRPALENVLEGAKVPNLEWDPTAEPCWATCEEPFFRQYGHQRGRGTANLDLRVYEYFVAASFPLKKGARFRSGSWSVRVADVLRETEGCRILLGTRETDLLLGPGERIQMSDSFAGMVNCGWVLLNRTHKTAFVPEQDSLDMLVRQGPRLSTSTRRLFFTSSPQHARQRSSATPLPTLDEEWLKDAELVFVAVRPHADCAREVRMESFYLSEALRPAREGGQRVRFTLTGPDLDALARIALPPNPTKDQARAYVRDILKASESQNRFAANDPQVEMLAKLGKDHVDVLLEFDSDSSAAPHLALALKSLIGPEHKALVLAGLAKHPGWARLVAEQGWHEDARAALVDGLKAALRQDDPWLPPSWIRAVANLRDPATYDDLKRYLVAQPHERASTHEAIRELPGIELRDAILEAWRSPKQGRYQDRLWPMEHAMELGEPTALEFAFENAQQGDEFSYQVKAARDAISRYTEARGELAALLKWYTENKDRLVFDSAKKKFVAPKPPAASKPPPPVAPPSPQNAPSPTPPPPGPAPSPVTTPR